MSSREDRVLIIGNNQEDFTLIKACFRQNHYSLSFAQSRSEVKEKINSQAYDLILLDITHRGLNGYDLCRTIHGIPEYHDIPILFLTSKTDKRSIMRGFKAGAVDYILKPFNEAEMMVRVRTHIELKNYREKLEQINIDLNKEVLKGIKMEDELRSSKEELLRVNRQLYAMATKDVLTGLFNRRKMLDFIEYEIERSNRNVKNFSVVLSDIDHFKKVNDTFGHDCGDEVLREFAGIFHGLIRKQDQVSRWGGEEFMFLLPETASEGALILAEKIRCFIEQHPFQCGETEIPDITMTFGIAEYSKGKDVDTLIKHADLALYSGKNTGRNRSVIYSAELEA